jgi:DNA-binding NarL/FixJ family response regulator
MTQPVVRMLVVDDLPTIREGLCLRLALEPDLVVVGTAGCGERALTLAGQLQPDVVLLDVVMPGMDGITATRLLRELLPACAIILVTLFDDANTRRRAAAAGTAAVVSKHEPIEVLLDAIRATVAGRSTAEPA